MTMNTDKVLALAREAGLAVTISSYDSLYKFAALIQRQMIEDGWRQCAEGQGTTQFCGVAEELRKDAERYRWLVDNKFHHMAHPNGDGWGVSDLIYGDDIDYAIDKARSANDT